MSITVDEFVQTRIPPEQHDIVKRLRDLMREYAPDAKEEVSYDMTVWKVKNIIKPLSGDPQALEVGGS